MIQGTTPTHIFTVVLDTESIDKLTITYAQNDVVVLKKTKADCVIEENKFIVQLTQEDTLKFRENATVQIQMKVRLESGEVLATDIKYQSLRKVLDKEVL